MAETAGSQAMHLFGVPRYVDAEGRETVFAAERPLQLLAHLACRRRWVARDQLAELFWPERDQHSARSNLRKVVLLARRIPGLPPLEQHGDLLRWSPTSDLEAFEQAVADGRSAEALALWRAPLMEGMESGLGLSATEWMELERQRVRGLWRAAAAARLDGLRREPEALLPVASVLLAQDPEDEATLLALGEALHVLGRQAEALQMLRRHAERLAEVYGLEPSAPLRHMAVRLQGASSASWVTQAAGVTRGEPLSHGTPLIGRRIESAQVRRLLAQDDCRVLTLSGPPGIGKTKLAQALLPGLATGHTRGAAWVALADLTDASQVPARIASALAVTLGGDSTPWRQLEAVLSGGSLLLVLDNCEHLALTQPLAGLLAACPNLQLLITSRARLGAAGEWLLPLEGLPLPDADETDAAILRHCDAVKLFELRSLQIKPDFDLARDAANVVRLVRMVEGLPLAIELAAAWTRVLSVSDIASELARSPDLLEPAPGTAHGSGLRASFAQSWRLLSGVERACLGRLAWLPGAFDRDMAHQVASASLPVLAALIDRSLLRAEPAGRYSMHALLRQCAAEHAQDCEMLAERHARFISHWLDTFGGMGQLPLQRIEQEIAHVRQAWAWGVARCDSSVLTQMSAVLDAYYQACGCWAEGVEVFHAAVASLDSRAPSTQRPLQLALRALSNLQFRGGALCEAETTARRSLQVARSIGDREAIRIALNAIGNCLCQGGRFAQGRACYAHARRHAERDGDTRQVAALGANIALADEALGEYEQALEGYRQVLVLHRTAGRIADVARNLNNMANLLRLLERPEDAQPLLAEALDLCNAYHLDATKVYVLVTLGLTHDDLGEYRAAADWLDRALTEVRAHGEPFVEASALLAKARLTARTGDGCLARAHLREAMVVAKRIGSPTLQIECVLSLGEILARDGDSVVGAALLQWGIAQPDLFRPDATAAQRSLNKLGLDAATVARGTTVLPPGAGLTQALDLASRYTVR
jgi:predicted ATPase/DNA-binding SARP family transcriptional activator/tetratricopeptide (TPR) repeat protein